MREGGEQTREEWVSPARVLQLLLILTHCVHNTQSYTQEFLNCGSGYGATYPMDYSAASTQHNTTYKNQNVQNFQNFNRLDL